MHKFAHLSNPIRDVAVGALVLLAGAALMKYADLPTKVVVLETKQTAIEKVVESMDGKLDRILERMENR